MKFIPGVIIFLFFSFACSAQQMTIAQMKTELEKTSNAPLYAKDVLKKKFKIDTIVITRTKFFNSLADSLGYKGQLKKVYGPYGDPGKKFLVQVLAKAPNTFNRVSQIFIDTSIMRYQFADSLGNSILNKINSGADTFEHQAQIYSMGGEGLTQGDLGWLANGVLIPEIATQLSKKKKGQVFRVWSRNGLHIIKKTEDPKQDTGFALLMRVFL